MYTFGGDLLQVVSRGDGDVATMVVINNSNIALVVCPVREGKA